MDLEVTYLGNELVGGFFRYVNIDILAIGNDIHIIVGHLGYRGRNIWRLADHGQSIGSFAFFAQHLCPVLRARIG